MTKRSSIETLFGTMLALGKIISQHTSESLEERTATMLQFSALRLIQEQQQVTVSEVGNTMKLSKSSATQLIERLVKAKFVKRHTDLEDRRIIRLNITVKGQEECIILKKKIMDKMEKVFSKIPDEDIQELIRIHTKLIKILLVK